ncbi:hypothetical protein E1176_03000 [Fulvivirga sp. RKSG066]|uniref:hypothetical protein n=1 Tax=Fulvivirga aurantia TaxID=2529383 RepID=UPI0012BC331B|nr:hypothetical protein [Fulvivirga aurantia]MTI19980.1 hypothetical protein [Fulvivirga aurantia]
MSKFIIPFIVFLFVIQLSFAQTPTNRIENTGNVGIGTIDPNEKLEIKDGSFLIKSNPYAYIGLERDAGGTIKMGVSTSGQDGFISTLNDLKFLTNGETTPKLRITAGGFVGIGTPSPTQLLQIDKAQDKTTAIKISNNNEGAYSRSGIILSNGETGKETLLVSTSANYAAVPSWSNSGVLSTGSKVYNGLVLRSSVGGIRFQPNGTTDHVVIGSGGKMGIGTTNPSHELDVAGTIHAEEVLVNLTVEGPDYVFEEDYPLQELSDLENYLKANKHLPEVPSAKEMEKEGIKVGEMEMLLLKKVEELTLHIIKLEKRIKELEK